MDKVFAIRDAPPEAARALRSIRSKILALDPETDLKSFLFAAARHLIEGTGAEACGIRARFPETARDLCLLVPKTGKPHQKFQPLSPEERSRDLPVRSEGEVLSAFKNNKLMDLVSVMGGQPRKVFSAPVAPRGRPVAEIELADPDPSRVPDPGLLTALYSEVGAVFELAFLHDRLRREGLEARLLYEVGQEMGRTLDLHELLSTFLDLLRQLVPFDAAVIYLLGESGLDVVDQSLRGYGEGQEDLVGLKAGQGISGWVARTGVGEIIPDVTGDSRYLAARPETRSEMVVPLKSGGRVIGVFNLESDRKYAYTAHDRELLETFAAQAAAALERARLLSQEESKRRLDQELRIARRIQRSFLPRSTESLRRLGLAGRWLPSEEVSGDYYDFMERTDGTLAVALADVSGKGIPAAIIMSTVRAAFRLEAAEKDDPADLCEHLNNFLVASLEKTEFVTGVFGFFDPQQRRFTYCNAGHNPPLRLRGDGGVEWLEAGGMILGAFAGQSYVSGSVTLDPEDLLVMYTDGVTEAYHSDRGEFDSEGLLEVVRLHANEPPAAVCSEIIRAVRNFVDGPLPDDLTLVVLSGRTWEEV